MTEQQSDWEGDQKPLNRKKAGVIKRVRAGGQGGVASTTEEPAEAKLTLKWRE